MADNACPGFRFAGLACGVKTTGRPDLGVIVADGEVPAAAVFTRNQVRAAPVIVSEAHVKPGIARAVIVNSGNANACTGERGLEDARAMAAATARALGCDDRRVLVASTGVIGQPLPIDAIVAGVPRAVEAARPDGLEDFTRAIMTTDRFEKRSLALVPLGPRTRARVVGVAKGAGMISPDMATTLAFVVTDAAVGKGFLRAALREATDATFNQISVDGDMSTNDTIFLLASGAAKNKPLEADGAHARDFKKALHDVLAGLATQIVRDGEGATHVARIEVMGAPSDDAARQVARRIAQSPLVKTAMFGADPNWGRIVAAIGSSGVEIDPARIDVAIGEAEICRGGAAVGIEAEHAAHAVMRRGEYTIRVHLHVGRGSGHHLTCDLGHDYVKLNADYRS